MTVEALLGNLDEKDKYLDVKTKGVTLRTVKVERYSLKDDGKRVYLRFTEGHELEAAIEDFVEIVPSAEQKNDAHWGVNYFYKTHK